REPNAPQRHESAFDGRYNRRHAWVNPGSAQRSIQHILRILARTQRPVLPVDCAEVITHSKDLVNTGMRHMGVRSPRQAIAAGTRPGGGTMPTVIAHHDVKDKDHWLASPRREEVFGPLGVTNIRTFVDPQK